MKKAIEKYSRQLETAKADGCQTILTATDGVFSTDGYIANLQGICDPKVAGEFAQRMLQRGVYVVSFCCPVVPKGRDRIRAQISAGHTRADLDFAVDCFRAVKEEMGI